MRLLIALGLAGVLVQFAGAQSAGAIAGRVVEEGTQSPIAGAEVTLIPVRSRAASMPPRDESQTALTDREGRYVFSGVAPGEYRVIARKSGFARFGGGAEPPPATTVTSGGRTADVNITLKRGGVIAGRVLDEDGQPVVDVRVMAMQKAPPSRGASPQRPRLIMAGGSAPTNDLGEYRLFGLPPGEYYVQAEPRSSYGPPGRLAAPNATTMLPTYFPNAPDPQSAHLLNVAAGQTIGEIEIRMVTAPAFHVSGVVIDEAGRPMANVLVKLVDETPGAMATFITGRPHQSRTDASGRFIIGNVTAGTYTLLAAPPVVVGREVPVAGGRVTMWGVGGTVSGSSSSSGTVTTETRDGTTVQFRDDTATRLPVAVGHSDVGGLEVMVRH